VAINSSAQRARTAAWQAAAAGVRSAPAPQCHHSASIGIAQRKSQPNRGSF
jgi:hypothetical protein